MPGHLTPDVVRKQIANLSPEPLYLVTGDDEAEMAALASELAESVDEDFRAFNVQRFYGTDSGTTLAAVFDAAGTLPLLAQRRVVLLLQAERVLMGKRARAGESEAQAEEAGGPTAKSEVARLKDYAQRPHAHAVVALIGPGLQRTFAPLAAHAAVVTCDASADVVASLAKARGVEFVGGAAELLRQRAGADVARLRADVELVLLYAAGLTKIGPDQVREVILKSAAAGGRQLWSLVAGRRTAAALRELELELAEGGVPYMILGLLRTVVERTVASQDLPRATDALLRTDLALKTSGGDPQVLLERLIVELCATGKD